MEKKKEIKICPACTKFDREKITKKFEDQGHDIKFGCIVYCRDRDSTKYPYFGLIDQNLVECSTEEEFFQKVNE